MKRWIGRNGYWDIVLTGRHGVEHIKAIQTGSGHQAITILSKRRSIRRNGP